MTLSATTFKIHRWLGWLVGLQVLVWITGGLVFSLVPFQPFVKAADAVRPPQATLPAGWAGQVAPGLQAAAALDDVASVSTVATPHGTALRVNYRGQRAPSLVLADGRPWSAPDEAAIRRFASSLYLGSAGVRDVERLARVPPRLGIVAETGGRGDLWRVRFDDALSTRIYLSGSSGEFVAVRNEAWVWYDFFFRLHVMDYSGGDDFNNTLLRLASVSAFGLVAAGAVLAVLAALRRWRVLRRHRAG